MHRSTPSSFWCAHPAAYPFLALLLAAAPGCDDPDDLLHVDIADDDEIAADAIAAHEAEEAEGAEGDLEPLEADSSDQPTPADGELSLTDEQSTRGAVILPTYRVFPPVRMDDLKPNHYPVVQKLSAGENKWDDIIIRRYAGGWLDYQPGVTPQESTKLSWGTPVYAGVDGEVMACWRTAPYDLYYSSVWHKLTISGNHIIIKTADGMWLQYAHLDTNTIPSGLCPKVSTNGGYMQAVDDDPDHRWYSGNSINIKACSDCPATEQYISSNRPQVHKGQFLGRMGGVGNAGGPHLHMRAGPTVPDVTSGVDRLVQDSIHITFEETWQAPVTGAAPPIGWTLSSGLSIPDAVTTDAALLWTGKKRQETYASSDYQLSKFGGGVGVDLLCHDSDQGTLYIDGNASPVPYGATDWQGSATWCTAASARLHTGDFNGDDRTDLLCHDRITGSIKIDHGVYNPNNGFTEYNGVDFTRPNPWCNTDTSQLLIGNFDDDTKDDLLCHDHADGRRWLDRSANGFNLTDDSFTTPWCAGHYQRLHVGRFDNLSAADDLLCHDTLTGQIWIDATPPSSLVALGEPIFGATDTHVQPWCAGRGNRLFSGSFVTSGTSWYDELICHDSDTGRVYVNVAGINMDYPGTSSTGIASGHCTGPYDRVKIGDVDGDNKDDLVCFNQQTGARSVDYATFQNSPDGLFGGADWTSSDNGWCRNSDEALR